MARRNPRTAAAMVLLVGVVFLAVGGVVGAVLNDAPRKPTTTTVGTIATTTTTLLPLGELGDPGDELEALIAAGRTVTHHAVYKVTDPELPVDLVQTLEVWRRDEHYRSDIVERAGDAVRRQSTIRSASSATACETVRGEQTCRVANIEALPPDLPAAFVRAVVTEDPLPELTVRDDDVAGFIARCFEAEGVGELCLAEDGVMLSVALEGAVLLATTLEENVPDAAFDTPGVVQEDDESE